MSTANVIKVRERKQDADTGTLVSDAHAALAGTMQRQANETNGTDAVTLPADIASIVANARKRAGNDAALLRELYASVNERDYMDATFRLERHTSELVTVSAGSLDCKISRDEAKRWKSAGFYATIRDANGSIVDRKSYGVTKGEGHDELSAAIGNAMLAFRTIGPDCVLWREEVKKSDAKQTRTASKTTTALDAQTEKLASLETQFAQVLALLQAQQSKDEQS